jgi:radical SAM superfamily enzyme YgiQ (UPF0313 family)
MKKYDCLYLHPTTHVKTQPSEATDQVTYVIMPMGTMALADLLDREGYETKIVHTGIEQMCNRNFHIEDVIKRHDPVVVGIDLHWYCHSYDAIRMAEIVKQSSNAFVVLGGLTASFFAEEILSTFRSVDAIVCGDAETPMVELMHHMPRGELSEVPNLIFREGESLQKSARRYVAERSDLDRLDFSNFKLVSNSDSYLQTISQLGDLDPFVTKAKLKTQGWACIGRGCSVNCSYCGGGRDAFKAVTGRQNPVFRSGERVVEMLTRFAEMKVSCAYIDFDPSPENRSYYEELFESIRDERIDISAQFLLWSISDKKFLDDFKRTFNPLYSTIALSPESGSEEIRQANKGFYYGNKELFRWLDHANSDMIPLQVYFSSGLSWETERQFEDTVKLGRKITREYPVVSIGCNAIELEPASPRFLRPEEHGVFLQNKSFADYFNMYRSIAQGFPVPTRLGYYTRDLSESTIIELSHRFRKAVSEELYDKVGKICGGLAEPEDGSVTQVQNR